MKKLLILIAFCYVTIAQAQNTRNDSYSAFGILTSFEEIPFGIGFYNVPINKEKLKLVSTPNKVPEFIDVVEESNIVGQIKPFHAGETLKWQVENISN